MTNGKIYGLAVMELPDELNTLRWRLDKLGISYIAVISKTSDEPG
jgi:hypothetical protein